MYSFSKELVRCAKHLFKLMLLLCNAHRLNHCNSAFFTSINWTEVLGSTQSNQKQKRPQADTEQSFLKWNVLRYYYGGRGTWKGKYHGKVALLRYNQCYINYILFHWLPSPINTTTWHMLNDAITTPNLHTLHTLYPDGKKKKHCHWCLQTKMSTH